MKKFSGFILFIAFLFMVTGCNSKEYDQSIQTGMDALKDEQYEDALASFKKAAESKKTEEVEQYFKYTNHMVDGLELFNKGEFSAAVLSAEKITKAKDSNKVLEMLNSKALKLKQEALEMDEQLQHAADDVAKGKLLLEQKNFDDAIQVFTTVAEMDPSHPKLEEISKEASDLMTEATKQKDILIAEQKAAEEAEKAKAAAIAQQRQDVFSFLKAASAKQHNYEMIFPSREAIQDYFASHFTREYSSYFIEKMYMEFDGVWQVIPTDYLIGYVPDFSYNENTKVAVNGNTITVSEWVPANDEGPVTWDAHTESVTLQKTGNGMIITKIVDY